MASTSKWLAANRQFDDMPAVVERPITRRLGKQLAKRREQFASESIDDNFLAATAIRKNRMYMTTTEVMASDAARTADRMQEIADGSELKASVIAPLYEEALAATQLAQRRAFRR
jgi:hypothetical protein